MLKECSPKCVSKKHADELNQAISNADNFEEQVITQLQTCYNVSSSKDSMGRTALQVAASFGRVKILSWLLTQDVQAHAKDEESGYSALHRAFFYGQLQSARILLRKHSHLNNPQDHDGMCPLDHLTKDIHIFKGLDPSLPCEVYVWGSNSNYLLGLEKQSSAEFPELLDAFPKDSEGIKQVAMSKFHSIFVTSDGRAFSCGIGQGGKLGHGSEITVISPTKINFDAESLTGVKTKKSTLVTQAAVGLHHSVLLTEDGDVMTFGMNQYHQLGHVPPPAQLLVPKFIKRFDDKPREVTISGICATRFHSVFWSSDCVYTCGLNAGALGHLKGDKTISLPRKVPSFSMDAQNITHVVASDGATAIATSRGDVYVLHEFQCRKIASKLFDLMKIVMIGGILEAAEEDLAADTISLQILLLTNTGKMFIWSQSNPTLMRFSFGSNNQPVVRDIALNQSSIVLVSKEGEAFIGALSHSPSKKSKECNSNGTKTFSKLDHLKREQVFRMHVKRIPGVYRANTIACDPLGKNFAVTQVHPAATLENIAKINPLPSNLQAELKQLFEEADPCDLIHDLVFQVDSREIAAHRFILSTNCYAFYRDTVLSSKSFAEDNKTVRITQQVPQEIFRLLLEFVYTGTCALFETETSAWKFIVPIEIETKPVVSETVIGKDGKRRKSEEFSRCERILRTVEKHARNFSILKLAEILGKARITSDGLVRNDKFNLQPKSWNRFCGANFYDSRLLSVDGIEFSSHRAVLTTRSDYFRSMFSYVWIENEVSRAIPLSIHSSVLEVVLDYIYEDKATKIEESDDVEWISNCLVVADLLLIQRLISMCEAILVRLLTIKNAGKMLEFASTYNAAQLKTSCMYFICNNLPAIVELRTWNCLSEDIMSDLSQFYQRWHPKIGSRLPTLSVIKKVPNQQFDITAISESIADITLTTNAEKDAKRRRPRRKTGKKGADMKGLLQSESLLSSEITKPTLENATKKEDSWCKVDKLRRRNKSLSLEIPSPSKEQHELSDKVGITIRSRDMLKNNSNQFEDTSRYNLEQKIESASPKQNYLTLLDIATVIQASTSSSENQKSKKFRKLTQKQRKLQSSSVIGDVSSSSPFESSSLHINDGLSNLIPEPTNSPPKVLNVWGSPDKIPNVSLARAMEEEKKLLPLQEIIIKEKLQQKNLHESNAKPLRLTLLEEKAIEELREFYGCDIVDDEYIVVERIVSSEEAAPVWSKKTPSKSVTKTRTFSMSDI